MGKNDVMLLVAAGAAGYILFKSKISESLGEAAAGIGTGLGSAVEGVGGGIADIGTAAGSIATGLGDGVNTIFDFLNPLEQLQQGISQDFSQANEVDLRAFDAVSPILTNIQGSRDIHTAEQKAARSADFQSTFTSVTDAGTDIIEKWANTGKEVITFEPISAITNWIQKQTKSLRSKISSGITGSAISGSSSGSSSSTQSGGSSIRAPTSSASDGSTSSFPSIFKAPDNVLTRAIAANAEQKMSIRAPVVVRKWYNPKTWF